ncbi:hypothetical protein PoB_003673500 [Plakobranchus ocellatus]|uniref:Uncharacterized protein n=1 Tax=Plakobranchus ocellatus TaxID=259542 RepID=A0AAV4ATJ6_9GAST|nr:hypothetical protein PoB_003673500 [Plakobranchus ocellatus]
MGSKLKNRSGEFGNIRGNNDAFLRECYDGGVCRDVGSGGGHGGGRGVGVGVSGTVVSESALRSAKTFLSWVRATLPAPWPDGGPKSLRSSCCGLAIYKMQQ